MSELHPYLGAFPATLTFYRQPGGAIGACGASVGVVVVDRKPPAIIVESKAARIARDLDRIASELEAEGKRPPSPCLWVSPKATKRAGPTPAKAASYVQTSVGRRMWLKAQ